jgi:hypothetical protein
MRVGDDSFNEPPTHAWANTIGVARAGISVPPTPARVLQPVYPRCRALAYGAKGDGDDQEARGMGG